MNTVAVTVSGAILYQEERNAADDQRAHPLGEQQCGVYDSVVWRSKGPCVPEADNDATCVQIERRIGGHANDDEDSHKANNLLSFIHRLKLTSSTTLKLAIL